MKTNIVLVGKPFSGVNTTANMIVHFGRNFTILDMDSLVSSFYYDFKRVMLHNGQMRTLVKNATIIKNAEYLYRAIGVPEFITAQKMYFWTQMFENHLHPLEIRERMRHDITEIQPLWRKIFAREKILECPRKNFIITHAETEEEIKCAGDYITCYVDADDVICYQRGYKTTNGGVFGQNILTAQQSRWVKKLRKECDCIINNNGTEKELAEQVRNMMIALGTLIPYRTLKGIGGRFEKAKQKNNRK